MKPEEHEKQKRIVGWPFVGSLEDDPAWADSILNPANWPPHIRRRHANVIDGKFEDKDDATTDTPKTA